MSDCCKKKKKRFDYLMWVSFSLVVCFYGLFLFSPNPLMDIGYIDVFSTSVFDLMNKMFWGLLAAIVFVGLLERVPKEFVMKVLGKGGSVKGVLRAAFAGVLLDLCSHGILVVGMKLYKRGASLGQVMAFIIASPWNSFSLTLVLWGLVGFNWMMTFLVLSMVIAIFSGLIFDRLVSAGVLSKNPNVCDLNDDFHFWKEFRRILRAANYSLGNLGSILFDGLKASKMVLRWILFGVILASLIRTFVTLDVFSMYFGPSILGLGLTLIAATVLEVCSEGSAPIAADVLNRAKAPGNAFAFLMTGVSTDYTEIMALKETTKSWKISLFLPLVTVPQIIVLALILNFA